MCCFSACLPRHQAKDVSRSHPHSTEPVRSPTVVQRRRTSILRSSPARRRRRGRRCRRPPRRFEAARAAPRRDRPALCARRINVASTSAPSSVRSASMAKTTSTAGSRARVPTAREARTVLRRSRARVAVARVRRAAPARREPHIRRVAGCPLGSRARPAGTSSARGVGTLSSTSPTTSSAVIRCTHSSGRSTRRCASAGNGDGLDVVREHEVAAAVARPGSGRA